MADLNSFVRCLVAMLRGQENPDPTLVLIAADWLEERGDPRAEELRVDWEIIQPREDPADRARAAVSPEKAAADYCRRAISLLSVNCPACNGRPFKITVAIAGRRGVVHSTITVEPWDLKDGDRVGILNGKVVKECQRIDSITVIASEVVEHLGHVVGDPVPCEMCFGCGVMAKN